MSMGYQFMRLFMEEHLLARLEKSKYGSSFGDLHVYTLEELEKFITKKLKKRLTKNYSKYIDRMIKDGHDIKKIIWLGLEKETEYYSAHFDDSFFIFEMRPKGHSYQYNGYQKAEHRIMSLGNKFLYFTLIYYILSWLFDGKEVIKYIKIVDFKMFFIAKKLLLGSLDFTFSLLVIIILYRFIFKYIMDPLFIE